MTELLYVLDFDRTLGDTDALNNTFIRLVGDMRPDLDGDLRKQMEATENTGVSFVTLDAARSLLSNEEYRSLVDQFISHRQGDEYLLPGARELLQYVDTSEHDVYIVTYGDPEWQMLKLRASGLADEVSYMVVENPSKSAIVLGWRQNDKKFLLPEGSLYDEVVVIDDKAKAFAVWDVNLVGYWVRSGDRLLPSQQGEIPAGVRVVRSLYEVVASEVVRTTA